jgi:hypothetical protein
VAALDLFVGVLDELRDLLGGGGPGYDDRHPRLRAVHRVGEDAVDLGVVELVPVLVERRRQEPEQLPEPLLADGDIEPEDVGSVQFGRLVEARVVLGDDGGEGEAPVVGIVVGVVEEEGVAPGHLRGTALLGGDLGDDSR